MSESQSTNSSSSTNPSSKSSSPISYKYIIAGGVAAILVGGSMWMLSKNKSRDMPVQNPNQNNYQEQMHEPYEEESQIYDNDRIVEEEFDSEKHSKQEYESEKEEIQNISESESIQEEEPEKKKKKVKKVYNYSKDCKICSFVKTDPSTGERSKCKKKIKKNEELCYFHKPKDPIS